MIHGERGSENCGVGELPESSRDSDRMGCPSCGSTNVRVIPRSRRPDVWFTIKAPRECNVCGTAFTPAAGIPLSILTIVVGVFFVGGVFFYYVVIPVMDVYSQGLSFRRLVALGGGMLTVCVFSLITYIGWRNLQETMTIRHTRKILSRKEKGSKYSC